MFKNQKLEALYRIASQRDVTHRIDSYTFILKDVEHLTDEETKLIELLTNMYTDVPSVARQVSELIRSTLQYNIINLDEMIRILKPYQQKMEEGKCLNQPLSFLIRHELSTKGLSEDCVKNKGRLCNLRIFLVQLSSSLTLTNEYEKFCIHSNIFDDIAKNGDHNNTDFLEKAIIDISQCETATVGYLCEHWMYTECKKGRIIPNPELKHRMEYFCGDLS